MNGIAPEHKIVLSAIFALGVKLPFEKPCGGPILIENPGMDLSHLPLAI